MARPTIYCTFCEAIEVRTQAQKMPGFPFSEEDQLVLVHGYASSRGVSNPFPECIGALDGICNRYISYTFAAELS